MADSDNSNKDSNGNGQVPMSVIDKFLTLNQANNQAYSEIVAVLDTLSSNILDMRNTVNKLDDQIETEKLGEVMQLCTDNIQVQVDTVVDLISDISTNHCSMRDSELIKAVDDCLKFKGIEANVFAQSIVDHLDSPVSKQANIETVKWVLETASSIKNNWGKLMVVFGASVAFIYINGGKSIIDFLSKFK